MEEPKGEKKAGGRLYGLFAEVDVLKQENLDALATGLGVCAMLFSLFDLTHLGAMLIAGAIMFAGGVIANAIKSKQ